MLRRHWWQPGWMAFAVWLLAAVGARATDNTPALPADRQKSNPARESAISAAPISEVSHSSAESASDADEDTGKPEPGKADVIYLIGPDGRPVPVRKDATVTGYLEWLEKQTKPTEAAVPVFSLAEVDLQGEVVGERALLDARIVVKVNRTDGWIRVPLQLNEATLIKIEAEVQRAADQSFAGFDREGQGYQWWLHGAGIHEIRLRLSVPVKPQLPGRRLALALPNPPAAITHLRLKVPGRSVTARAAGEALPRVQPAEGDHSEIEVYGLGNYADLSWQPQIRRPVRRELECTTLIGLEVGESSVLLTARQTMRVVQGTHSSVTVRLPAGFELVSLDGRRYASHRMEGGSANHVTVSLTQPLSGGDATTELKWVLQKERLEDDEPLVLDGFEVVGARRQTGYVAIERTKEWQLTTDAKSSRFVRRVGAEELRSFGELRTLIGTGELAAGYRFLQQPFRLVLDVQRVRPYLGVQPHVFLRMRHDRMELEAVFQMTVYRGLVRELELRWPGRRAQGWHVEPILPQDGQPAVELHEDAETDSLRLSFSEGVATSFDLRLRAERPVPENDPTQPVAFRLTLPAIADEPGLITVSARPMILAVASDDDVESTLEAEEGTDAELVARRPADAPPWPSGLDALRRLTYRVDADEPAFLAQVQRHSRTVSAESLLEVRRGEDYLDVVQRLTYTVAYEPLDQVRIRVPSVLKRQVSFSLGEVELLPKWLESEGGDDIAQLAFVEPQIQRFEIRAAFRVETDVAEADSDTTQVPAENPPPTDRATRSYGLPVLQPTEAELDPVRIRFLDLDGLVATIPQKGWRREAGGAPPVWIGQTIKQRVVPVVLQNSPQLGSPSYVVERIWLRSVWGTGTSVSWMRCRIRGSIASVVLIVPEGVVPRVAWWDRREVPIERLGSFSAHTETIRIPVVATGEQESHLLTLEYRQSGEVVADWSHEVGLSAPRFPETVEVGEVVWEVVVPWHQHLFTEPTGFLPRYQWRPSPVFWARQTVPQYARLDEWIGADDGPALPAEIPDSHVYCFGRLGDVSEMHFRTMSRSMLLLVGAGLSLAFGFLLIKVPASRSVIGLLGLVFGVCAASLWYAAPLKVLAQPAVVGMVLAVMAATGESYLRRRRAASVITLSSPSDFVTSTSSIQEAVLHVGPQDPTVVRPAARSGSAALSGSEPASSP